MTDRVTCAHGVEVCQECAADYGDLRSHADVRRDALEEAAKIADGWAAHYPEDVWPPGGTSLDSRAAAHGRHVAKQIALDLRKMAAAPRPPSSPPCVPCAEGIGTGVPHTCQRRPPSSPDPATRSGLYSAHRDGEDPGCRICYPAPSPDPGARPDRCKCGQVDMTGRLLRMVGGGGSHSREQCDPPAPSPAAVAHCTTCGLPTNDPNHAGSPPGCPGPAAAEAPRREDEPRCTYVHWSGMRCCLPPHDGEAHRVSIEDVIKWQAAPPQTKEGAP